MDVAGKTVKEAVLVGYCLNLVFTDDTIMTVRAMLSLTELGLCQLSLDIQAPYTEPVQPDTAELFYALEFEEKLNDWHLVNEHKQVQQQHLAFEIARQLSINMMTRVRVVQAGTTLVFKTFKLGVES